MKERIVKQGIKWMLCVLTLGLVGCSDYYEVYYRPWGVPPPPPPRFYGPPPRPHGPGPHGPAFHGGHKPPPKPAGGPGFHGPRGGRPGGGPHGKR